MLTFQIIMVIQELESQEKKEVPYAIVGQRKTDFFVGKALY